MFLLVAIVGSGIMGERLADGNDAIALLANSIATGGALMALIVVCSPVSGAHFNPVVTFVMAMQRRIGTNEAAAYIAVQIFAAMAGVAIAHIMFGEPIFSASMKIRTGPAQWLSEFIATFGLLAVIWGSVRSRQPLTAAAVIAAYIVGAYWFTSSTSFANPAVTLARAASNTFAGIRPDDIAAFIAAQFVGALTATLAFGWLLELRSRPQSRR
jgi:glycerol uptake facilitator-like aquaporin